LRNFALAHPTVPRRAVWTAVAFPKDASAIPLAVFMSLNLQVFDDLTKWVRWSTLNFESGGKEG